jgi:Uma2 family endonuclease
MEVRRVVRPIQRAYLRPPEPVHCTALFDILRLELEGKSYVGSNQFVYWDATNPKLCLSPDIMVRIGASDQPLPCLKVWEFGAPDLAVEIISRSDAGSLTWDLKLLRYRAAGVAELVRFDPEDRETPLRIWDRIEDDLVERDPAHSHARYSDVLELWWQVMPDARLGQQLRLARDAAGKEILLSSRERLDAERAAKEAERAAREAERAAKEAERAAREAERAAKEAALARIAELEAQLSKR